MINEILDIVAKFIGIAVGLVSLIEFGSKLRSKPPEQGWWKTVIITVQWLFLVITTLGLCSIALALFGAYLGTLRTGNINDQFRYSIGYVTGFSILYGVFWGSIIRPWLGDLFMNVVDTTAKTNKTEQGGVTDTDQQDCNEERGQ